MKNKFEVGDKVVCVMTSEWQFIIKDGISDGSTHVVTDAKVNGHVKIDYNDWWHSQDKFRHAVDVVTVILRRPVDRFAIEKVLKDRGYGHDGDNPVSMRNLSRVINIHLASHCKGKRTFYDPCSYKTSVKQTILDNDAFMKSHFGHEHIVVVKSKPSVNKAIEEILKYI